MKGHMDFSRVSEEALARFPGLLMDWLPGGKIVGTEYLALNPRRPDRCIGSFSVNVKTGRWCDFATGDKGGDPVSLYAYLLGLSQGDAARELAEQLGVGCV